VAPALAPPAADRAVAGEGARSRAAGAAKSSVGPPAPADYIRRIEALLTAGRPDDAAQELQRFRDAYPDADERLPASLREFAAKVPRRVR
jgi:hypothetical protein